MDWCDSTDVILVNTSGTNIQQMTEGACITLSGSDTAENYSRVFISARLVIVVLWVKFSINSSTGKLILLNFDGKRRINFFCLFTTDTITLLMSQMS